MHPDGNTGPLGRATLLLLSRIAATGVPAGLSAAPVHAEGLTVIPVALLPESVVGNPIRIRSRYLVCAGGPASAALFDQLLSQEQDFLVPDEVPLSLWQAMGLTPRMGLFFDVPVHFERKVTQAPRVTSLPQFVPVEFGQIRGSVVTPSGVPLAGMRIATADGNSFTHSDSKGNFLMTGVPGGTVVRLVVSGRGQQLAAEVPAISAEPVVITCEM